MSTPVIALFDHARPEQTPRDIEQHAFGIDSVGMDVVRVAPACDVGEITALAGARLAMEMLYLCACRPGA